MSQKIGECERRLYKNLIFFNFSHSELDPVEAKTAIECFQKVWSYAKDKINIYGSTFFDY